MTILKCILCLKQIRRIEPIPLTRKVNENMSMEDCIRECFPYWNLIINQSPAYTCSACYRKFVEYRELLKTVNENYAWISTNNVDIKIEADEDYVNVQENLVLECYDKYSHIIRDCSVVLTRCDVSMNDEETSIELDDDQADSDFEWPDNDNEMEEEVVLEEVLSLRTSENEKEEEEEKEVKSERKIRIKRHPVKKARKKIPDLPRNLMTPQILSSDKKFVTVDGVKYRIPKNIEINDESLLDHAQLFNRRPHRAFDIEGERIIAENVDLKCHECGIRLPNFMRVKKHFKKCHPNINGYIKCRCGPSKFTRRYELLDHLDVHLSNERYKCEICNNGAIYKSRKSLINHQRQHTNGMNSSVMCDLCGKLCGNIYLLKDHMETHDARTYECFICHKAVRTSKKLKMHMRRKHHPDQGKDVICPFCSKTLKEYSMKYHIKYHHSNKKRRRVKCTLCDHWMLETSLKCHMMKHTGESNVHCPECGKICTSSSGMKRHMLTHNESEWKNECEQCGKRFALHFKLQEHIAIHHTREFLYACRVCGKQYRVRANWKQHEKHAHPEEYEKHFKPAYKRSNDDPLIQAKAEEMDLILNEDWNDLIDV